MKRILFIIAFFFAFGVSAQTKPVNKKSEVKKEKTIKSKKKTKMTKAGKVDPNEKGSGMTIPKQDQPALDKKPNPAATIPSKELPADENPKP
ncbi:hypothetical protein HUK80_02500 [Flavobacterium sp. MAH-1]|uniref:Uncharacterized protein n=1 Tax=Flavobacterium agri TaxID=2743471 RepID=A0A7Y8XZE8_9FLAO|nr:hypothetical protein [Flavobacterium agri]NUY79751.1 hypothetical protein [Flavobacterium agri]NYA69776.1 hypothetical protein [Flavobacterium agri]